MWVNANVRGRFAKNRIDFKFFNSLFPSTLRQSDRWLQFLFFHSFSCLSWPRHWWLTLPSRIAMVCSVCCGGFFILKSAAFGRTRQRRRGSDWKKDIFLVRKGDYFNECFVQYWSPQCCYCRRRRRRILHNLFFGPKDKEKERMLTIAIIIPMVTMRMVNNGKSILISVKIETIKWTFED